MSASINSQINSPVVEVVALALQNITDKKYLLARRGPGGSGAGFWEFPGGKIELGETQVQALCREILEELAFVLDPQKLAYVGKNEHAFGNRKVLIFLFRYEVNYRPEFRLLDHDRAEWYLADQLKEINLSEADKSFISLI